MSIKNKSELSDVAGQLFSIRIQADAEADDLFSMERKVYLVLFGDQKPVSKSEVISIRKNETLTKEFTFDGHMNMEVHLLDAATKQQLDRASVKQNQDRDLGGLL